MAAFEIVPMTIDTTQGRGPYIVPVGAYNQASILAVANSSNISTGVLEVKKVWTFNEPTGISFGVAKTVTLDGSAALEDIDIETVPYLLIDVTTFEADKSVQLVVYLTDTPAHS